MNERNQGDDDGGTVLEPIGQLLPGVPLPQHAVVAGSPPPRMTMLEAVPPVPAAPGMPAASSGTAESTFCPVIRPPVPMLTVLDDGDLANGEVVRLRDHVTVIGRSEGTVRIAHDPLVSGRHAEIMREGAAPPYRWTLRDLGSSNGTFVSCIGTTLRPDRLIILGSRRFRFQPSSAQASMPIKGTMMIDSKRLAEQSWPTLVETTNTTNPLRISLAGPSLSVGRPGHGNRIEIDDPLLAPLHASITLTASGEWRIEARPSRNGIWVQINAIRLVPVCRFQCGEQRFLFVCDR